MHRKHIITYIMIFIFIHSGSLVHAFEQEDFVIHGFVSQGYLKSTDNNYLGKSKNGSYEFNEIGLNIALPIADALRFGIQLFSRDLGDEGNN